MTDTEKFEKSFVLEKDKENIYLLELWGGSTKHPDTIFSMKNFLLAPWVDKNNEEEVRSQIFQWICECASKMLMPSQAKRLVEWALENYEDWNG